MLKRFESSRTEDLREKNTIDFPTYDSYINGSFSFLLCIKRRAKHVIFWSSFLQFVRSLCECNSALEWNVRSRSTKSSGTSENRDAILIQCHGVRNTSPTRDAPILWFRRVLYNFFRWNETLSQLICNLRRYGRETTDWLSRNDRVELYGSLLQSNGRNSATKSVQRGLINSRWRSKKCVIVTETVIGAFYREHDSTKYFSTLLFPRGRTARLPSGRWKKKDDDTLYDTIRSCAVVIQTKGRYMNGARHGTVRVEK